MNDFAQNVIYLSVALVVVLVIFLVVVFILRGVFCWYFKINEAIKLKKESNEVQEENNKMLKELLGILKDAAKKD